MNRIELATDFMCICLVIKVIKRPRFEHVSSSLVRKSCQRGEAIDALVPAPIAEAVRSAYR